MAKYFFSSESVSEGHPDKVADQISDAILDALLALDSNSKVAIETMVTTNQVVLAGEVHTSASVNYEQIAREVIKRIGYTKPEYNFDYNNCKVLSFIHQQSADIRQGVEREDPMNQGAGDQGIMFGYACDETSNLMPISLDLSHALLKVLADIRHEGKLMPYLRPDAKSQVTIEYGEDGKPLRVDTVVVSTQHDDFVKAGNGKSQEEADHEMQARIEDDVKNILLPRVLKLDAKYADLFKQGDYKLLVNPTGKFVIGGPDGDTGLTGRKIIVDTYGGKGAHGGGAFSGKDPSKVDRSAAYAARHLAKNIVAAGLASEVLVQLAYAIGVARPMNLYINTYGTSTLDISDGEMADRILKSDLFDMRPKAIEERLQLRNPIYEETAAYGHVGRTPEQVNKAVPVGKAEPVMRKVQLFAWEQTDRKADLRRLFGL
jgi:S-adenosylmethionine synthetase